MQTSVTLLGMLAALEDNVVLVELPLLDRHVDLDDILPYDSSGSDGEVTAAPICVNEADQR